MGIEDCDVLPCGSCQYTPADLFVVSTLVLAGIVLVVGDRRWHNILPVSPPRSHGEAWERAITMSSLREIPRPRRHRYPRSHGEAWERQAIAPDTLIFWQQAVQI